MNKLMSGIASLAVMAWATTAFAIPYCPLPITQPDGTVYCQEQPEDPPPPPPTEPNRLAGSDGNPLPNQNRCGDNQIPVSQCPQYQDLAYYTDHCINTTEYYYAQSHSIAPLCSAIDPTSYIGFCYCGCLERSTEIYVKDPNGKSSAQRIDQLSVGGMLVHALTEDTTLSKVRYQPRDVEAVTVGGERLPLVVFHLANGTELATTELHAMLLSTGVMVAAKDALAGQQLVNQDGSTNTIMAITHAPTSDDVYNVLTNAGLSHKGHMIVANGVIVGDLMWQNTLAKDLNAVVVRQ